MTIGTKFTGYTAISGVVDTLLGGAALEIPDGAKQIVGIIPYVTSPAGNTANEPVAAKVFITSEDATGIVPYTVLAQPIGSSLLKAVCAVQGEAKFYPIYAPVKGGERIKIYGTGLFDHTIEPYVGALLIYSDQAPTKTQVHAAICTFTNTGTAAARVAVSTPMTVVGGKYLKEIFGYAVGTTVAALKGIASHIDFTSEGFLPAWILHLVVNPISGQVDTNIQEACAGVARREVGVAMKDKCVINIGHTLAVALTTTGNFVAGILYN